MLVKFRLHFKRCFALCICIGLLCIMASCTVVRDEERVVGSPNQAVVVPSPAEPSANSAVDDSIVAETSMPESSFATGMESPQKTEDVGKSASITTSPTPETVSSSLPENPSSTATVRETESENGLNLPQMQTDATETAENPLQGTEDSSVPEVEITLNNKDSVLESAQAEAESDYDLPENVATSDGHSVGIISIMLLFMIFAAVHVHNKVKR